MPVRFALLMLLAGCAEWTATRVAGVRRVAAAGLEMCLLDSPCSYRPNCFLQARAYCVDAGAEPSCGEMEPEKTPCGGVTR